MNLDRKRTKMIRFETFLNHNIRIHWRRRILLKFKYVTAAGFEPITFRPCDKLANHHATTGTPKSCSLTFVTLIGMSLQFCYLPRERNKLDQSDNKYCISVSYLRRRCCCCCSAALRHLPRVNYCKDN